MFKRYGFAKITDETSALLKTHVVGKRVLDVGCGDLALAKLCMKLGAKSVTALDSKNPNGFRAKLNLPEGVSFVESTFQNYSVQDDAFDVALLSWPANYDVASAGIVRIIDKIPTVFYIGCNDGATQCGTPLLWDYLSLRELIAVYEPQYLTHVNEGDHVLVYNNAPRTAPLAIEEKYGLDLLRAPNLQTA